MPLTLTRSSSKSSTTPDRSLVDLLPTWRPVLDSLCTNVFLADPDLTLVYANPQAMATLGGIERDFRDAFGVGPGGIVGGSIHRFHRNADHVEQVLRGGKTNFPHVATFTFGSISLRTNISEVRDTADALLGYSVAWEDVTSLQASRQLVGQLGENLDSAAGAVEELSASINEVARSASHAAERTSEGTTQAATTTVTVRELGEATTAISSVVRTITTIAEQTNILALNATIEAARAGDAGKGFAVVASEVKQLANDTANATEDIQRRIDGIRSSTGDVVDAIEGIASLLSDIDEIQATVASTVDEQRLASDQLARSVGEAAASGHEAITRQDAPR